MQAEELIPTLSIVPFENKYAVKARVEVNKEYQANYVSKSFFMFVMQIRSGMSERDIEVVKKSILEMCEEALDRSGIEGIGFVMNENYYTIRQPNYEGIKDLLTANMKISDTTDFTRSLTVLRHSIQNQAKKTENSVMSLFMFTSCVATSPLNPLKPTSLIKRNQHIQNYHDQIRKLKKTIHSYCINSRPYVVGFSNYDSNLIKEQNSWSLYNYWFTDIFDSGLLYNVMGCCHQSGSFQIAKSYEELKKTFESTTSVALYDYHSLMMMIPVNQEYSGLKWKCRYLYDKKEEEIDQNMEEDDEKLEEYYDELYQLEYQKEEKKINEGKFEKIFISNIDEKLFLSSVYYFDKTQINLQRINDYGYHLVKKVYQKQSKFPIKKKLMKKIQTMFEPSLTAHAVEYYAPSNPELILYQTNYYRKELEYIASRFMSDIVSYKRKYIAAGKYQYFMEVDEQLQLELRMRVEHIEEVGKEIVNKIWKQDLKGSSKRECFELYSELKLMIDSVNQTLMKTLKKELKSEDIGSLSEALNHRKVKASIRRKLIKRVNSNPKLVDQIEQKVEKLCRDFNCVNIEAQNKQSKQKIGNCVYSGCNFAGALKNEDCLGLVFEVERNDAAIMDPGQIKIRQVSPYVMCANVFFRISLYGFNQFEHQLMDKIERAYFNVKKPQDWEIMEKETDTRKQMELQKNNYQERWDYWDRAEKKSTALGIMPLYGSKEHWSVAKLMMKPCLAWTACGQPLAYCFAQYQKIPFIVLSFLIRKVQETKYAIDQLQQKAKQCKTQQEFYHISNSINQVKQSLSRYQDLLEATEQTCFAIFTELSQPHYEFPLVQSVKEQLANYQKPIHRTVDVISSNACFLGQIYCGIKLGRLEKMNEDKFHQFFKRIIEEELRRQTYGWNEQEEEDVFMNKLLNAKTEQMEKPEYIIIGSVYLDRFEQARRGIHVAKTEFQIKREHLQMMLKENNTFNDHQRMALIEYKRLYENKVLWFWYIRFMLYEEKPRIQIHKWKCLGLINSYMLFTMIIQNKRQRRNWKRRNAIMNGFYVDPFDYYSARPFLEQEFMKMRNKKEKKNIVMLENQKYRNAAEVFSRSPDINEAAGALMNAYVGNQIRFFYQQLLRGKARCVEQKLKLLLLGQHRGVYLFKDGWKMSKKRMRKISLVYPMQFDRYKYMF